MLVVKNWINVCPVYGNMETAEGKMLYAADFALIGAYRRLQQKVHGAEGDRVLAYTQACSRVAIYSLYTHQILEQHAGDANLQDWVEEDGWLKMVAHYKSTLAAGLS